MRTATACQNLQRNYDELSILGPVESCKFFDNERFSMQFSTKYSVDILYTYNFPELEILLWCRRELESFHVKCADSKFWSSSALLLCITCIVLLNRHVLRSWSSWFWPNFYSQISKNWSDNFPWLLTTGYFIIMNPVTYDLDTSGGLMEVGIVVWSHVSSRNGFNVSAQSVAILDCVQWSKKHEAVHVQTRSHFESLALLNYTLTLLNDQRFLSSICTKLFLVCFALIP